MSFCSFTKDFSKNSITAVSNAFITEFLPEANGDAVKVYLYGLFLCSSSDNDIDLSSFAKQIYMSEETIRDYFLFWEEYGVVSILADEPFTVKYLGLADRSKARKFKPEKYSDFTKAIQLLITDRMISTSEYSEYFSLMEDYSIKPEALLMIVKYCVDLKGANIGYRYITSVAKDFATRNITTADAVDKELADYNTRSADIIKILTAIGSKRLPDIEDLKRYNKWHNELQFELESILFSIKAIRVKSMDKLDEVMMELYQNKCFSMREISDYQKKKDEINETVKSVARELGVYCAVTTPFSQNYIAPWQSKGYSSETLIYIAKYCFKKKRCSFELMNDTIKELFNEGLVTIDSIADRFKKISKDDMFIRQLFSLTAIERNPTSWDRQNLKQWHEWGFTDEMIIEAASVSAETSRPMVYMNTVLGNWKNDGIFTTDKIPQKPTNTQSKKPSKSVAPLFGNERKYTTEELNNLLDDIDNIDL